MAAHAGKRKIFLHACCASCASYVIELLSHNYIPYLFFYNPNIYPKPEYLQRLEDIEKLCAITQTPLLVPQYDIKKWYQTISGCEQEPEGGARCRHCFDLRLTGTADASARESVSLFATTLTISPHKNAQKINEIGYAAAQKAGIHYLESDFKKNDGFKKSCRLSTYYGFRRQNYCGCQFSFR